MHKDILVLKKDCFDQSIERKTILVQSRLCIFRNCSLHGEKLNYPGTLFMSYLSLVPQCDGTCQVLYGRNNRSAV